MWAHSLEGILPVSDESRRDDHQQGIAEQRLIGHVEKRDRSPIPLQDVVAIIPHAQAHADRLDGQADGESADDIRQEYAFVIGNEGVPAEQKTVAKKVKTKETEETTAQ